MNSVTKKHSNMYNAIRIISMMAWVTFIAVANLNQMIIEAYLLSIVIVTISYLVFTNNRTNKGRTAAEEDVNRVKKADFSNNNYFQVFFNYPIS